MIETGEVVRTGIGDVDVRIAPSGQCESCGACAAVGANAMLLSGVADEHGARVGDEVEVDVPDGSRLRAALVGFGLPVLVLVAAYLAGFLLGSWLGTDPDITGAVLAGAVVAVGLIWLREHGRRVMSQERFRPRVRAIIRRSAP
jgi:sigma-E factor negative regulatory protein RseC